MENPTSRKINTLHFGEIEIDDEHIYHFPNGMLGFEYLKNFVLISEEETDPFKWLISVDEPEIGFPLLSPWHIDMNYNPGNNFDLNKHVVFVVVTLEDKKGFMTANMKAPVFFDIEGLKGEQSILPSDKYSPNFIINNRKKSG